MVEALLAGGPVMLPIGLASVAALGICLERAWTLRRHRVAPPDLVARLCAEINAAGFCSERLPGMCERSPLGRILVASLAAGGTGGGTGGAGGEAARERAKAAMTQAAPPVVHDLERYLTALGAIASATPLLGLLGTVLGMIRVFSVIVEQGAGNPAVLAGGISEALVSTAAGIGVAVPALVCHRVLVRKVDELVVTMEGEAVKLADAVFPLSAPPP